MHIMPSLTSRLEFSMWVYFLSPTLAVMLNHANHSNPHDLHVLQMIVSQSVKLSFRRVGIANLSVR